MEENNQNPSNNEGSVDKVENKGVIEKIIHINYYGDDKGIPPEEYKKFIIEISKSRPKVIFNNDTPSNANFIISQIFNLSKNVKLFVNDMDGTIHGVEPDYIESLENFLQDSNKSIEILFLNKPKIESNAYQKLIDRNVKCNVEIKLINNTDEASKKLKKEFTNITDVPEKTFFAIGDESIFRLQRDPDKKSAFFCFDDVNTTNKLSNIFIDLWQNNSIII